MIETLYAALIGDLVASRRDGGQREASVTFVLPDYFQEAKEQKQ